MSKTPEHIDWLEVASNDCEKLDEFYRNFETVNYYLDRVEASAAEAFIDPLKQKQWDLIGTSEHKDKDITQKKMLETESFLKAISAPLVGKEVSACGPYIEKIDDRYVADLGDYGYFPSWKGVFGGAILAVVHSKGNYPRGFGDHVPGAYPKIGDFEEYQFCFEVGERFIPARSVSVRDRSIRLVSAKHK